MVLVEKLYDNLKRNKQLYLPFLTVGIGAAISLSGIKYDSPTKRIALEVPARIARVEEINRELRNYPTLDEFLDFSQLAQDSIMKDVLALRAERTSITSLSDYQGEVETFNIKTYNHEQGYLVAEKGRPSKRDGRLFGGIVIMFLSFPVLYFTLDKKDR